MERSQAASRINLNNDASNSRFLRRPNFGRCALQINAIAVFHKPDSWHGGPHAGIRNDYLNLVLALSLSFIQISANIQRAWNLN